MIDDLNRYYDDGLLTKQTHPSLPLYIWNYTPKVQIDKLWDEITLQCRGLVTDYDGNVIARPFSKFFNYSELEVDKVPNEQFRIFEKADGSLGILFYYQGQWVFASRGSFTSDYANKAKDIFEKNGNPRYDLLNEENTYLFEIIFPEGRIVVDYGNVEKLVLLGVIHTSTGGDLEYEDMIQIADSIGVDIVKVYNTGYEWNVGESFNYLKDTIADDEEGRVVRFRNGFRMKVKGDEYVRLHYIITNFSSRKIWEIAKSGQDIHEFLVDVPDEFYTWAIDTLTGLELQFQTIKNDVEDQYWELIDRKEYALKIKNNNLKHLLFKRLTSHSDKLNDMIWDMIYPEYFNPFSNKTIEDEN